MNVKRSISFVVGFGVVVASVLAVSGVAGTTSADADRSAPANAFVRELDAFDRARGANDVAPVGLVGALDGIEGTVEVPSALRPGSLGLEKSRRLASRLGELSASVYIFPTSKGRACIALYVERRGGPQTCVTSMEAPLTWALFDYDSLGVGAPTGVFGLVRDDVVAVNVAVAGKLSAAVVNNDAYFFEAPDGSVPEAVIATLENGQRSSVRLPRPRG